MKILFHLPVLFLSLFPIFYPTGAAAVPREVTLFPSTAKVVDISRVALQPSGNETFKAVITLPAQTVPESLTTALPSDSPLRIDDQNWRQITRLDDTRIADLRKQIQNLKTERIGILSGMQALDAQVQFWQAQAKTKTKTPEETVSFSTLLTRSIKKAIQEKLALEPDLEKTDKKIKELQDDLNRMTGQKETLWEVTLLFSGPPAKETTLTLAYSMTGCGWNPLYRLDARPRDGLIQFAWEAEVWQSSGSDWSQVETHIATLPSRSGIAPPEFPAWIIRPKPEVLLRARQKSDARELAAPAPMAALAEAPDSAPQETRQSTYAVWNLGKKNIAAGSRQRMKVRTENWPAEFVHLIRPGLNTQAYIHASVKHPESKEIPSGQATFLIDGAVLGKRSFSFAGQEGNLSFGVDPLVLSETTLLSQKSGEKGFIADKQTHEWAWKFLIRNTRESAVKIRIEDPLPQVRDERIKVFMKHEPEPLEKTNNTLIWKAEIPAGQSMHVLSTIRIEAPKEMDLDLGWRR